MTTVRNSLLREAFKRKQIFVPETRPQRLAEAERLVAEGYFEKVCADSLEVYQLTDKGRHHIAPAKE